MDIKILLIMGLLSFGGGEYINAQNKQENSIVKEFTKEQKEKLEKMYSTYQQYYLKPGISKKANVKDWTEPLPWIEMQQKGFDWSNVKDWLSNAKLEIYNPFGAPWLLLRGKYVPHVNIYKAETLECINKKDSIGTLCELTVAPIKIFGNMGIKFISHLQSASGDFVGFSKYYPLTTSKSEQEITLSVRPSCDDSIDCKGSVEVELLPPLPWKHTRISLLPEDEGKEYEFDGVKFKVFKSNPGDVILEYDEKYAEQMDKSKLILIRGQQLIKCGNNKMSGDKEILQLYQHPDMEFGEWCVRFLGVNCDSFGTTPEALKLARKKRYQPTSEELRHFHETLGEIVGYELKNLLKDIQTEDVNPKNYKEFYQQWIKKGYEAAIEFKGDYYDAMGCFSDRYGNDSEPYIGFLRGARIGSFYVKADLQPDWDIINRSAIAVLNQYNSANADSLCSIIEKHGEEYIEPIVSRGEILPFLTDKDIEHLSKKVTKDESPIMYCWYKTDTDADAMYIYKPDEKASNKPLVKARYYLDGRKPEIIFPE